MSTSSLDSRVPGTSRGGASVVVVLVVIVLGAEVVVGAEVVAEATVVVGAVVVAGAPVVVVVVVTPGATVSSNEKHPAARSAPVNRTVRIRWAVGISGLSLFELAQNLLAPDPQPASLAPTKYHKFTATFPLVTTVATSCGGCDEASEAETASSSDVVADSTASPLPRQAPPWPKRCQRCCSEGLRWCRQVQACHRVATHHCQRTRYLGPISLSWCRSVTSVRPATPISLAPAPVASRFCPRSKTDGPSSYGLPDLRRTPAGHHL